MLHFGNARNPYELVEVLDGRLDNDRFWVFFAAATSRGFDLVVEAAMTGEWRACSNPDGVSAETVAETPAFAPCDAS